MSNCERCLELRRHYWQSQKEIGSLRSQRDILWEAVEKYISNTKRSTKVGRDALARVEKIEKGEE